MNYTRNSDIKYYEENPYATNCGSYALRLNEWYELDYLFEDVMGEYIDEWIIRKNEEGWSDFEISCEYENILVDCMLNEFEDELELACFSEPPKSDNVELIAFNTFCYYNDNGSVDFDYHFKVFRDGVWKEKCGTGPVVECGEDDWGDYIADTIYMYHKIGVVNEIE